MSSSTSQSPGLTVSASRHDDDGRDYVVQIDITLRSLSEFLSSLEIGRSGRCRYHGQGGPPDRTLPAGVDMLRQRDGAMTTARVDEVARRGCWTMPMIASAPTATVIAWWRWMVAAISRWSLRSRRRHANGHC